MDQQVLAAMQRWPDVPDIAGWLRLDRRGKWLLIDRNAPNFDEALHGRGSPITNTQIIEFVGRNYAGAQDGRWYWQNGPQRAFVELDLAPWIGRVVQRKNGHQALITHTGLPCEDIQSWHTDEQGVLYAKTEHGPCAIHDLDLSSLEVDFDESVLAGQQVSTHETTPRTHGAILWNGRSAPLESAQPLLAGVVLSPLAALSNPMTANPEN